MNECMCLEWNLRVMKTFELVPSSRYDTWRYIEIVLFDTFVIIEVCRGNLTWMCNMLLCDAFSRHREGVEVLEVCEGNGLNCEAD